MKFCENCGTQLEDNAVFCEECGTKIETIEAPSEPAQSAVNTDLGAEQVSSQNTQPKLSETCKPAKREIKDWLLILLLIMCSPLIIVNLIMFLPDFLFWVTFIALQAFVIVLMWQKRSWHFGVKTGVTIAYFLMYII